MIDSINIPQLLEIFTRIPSIFLLFYIFSCFLKKFWTFFMGVSAEVCAVKRPTNLKNTGDDSEFLAVGAEFVNYIATTATCRIIRISKENGLLEDQTYFEMMEYLCEAWRMIDDPEHPSYADKEWVHTTKDALKTLEAFGLSTPAHPLKPKCPVGRLRKEPEGEPKPKRPVGRPRKEPEGEPALSRSGDGPQKEPTDAGA
ncbi:MAG: hypothetical protein K6E40_17520 [Desulfovibrio sp.]|nr:hypothetical protein [Desulfovibrio sp.]